MKNSMSVKSLQNFSIDNEYNQLSCLKSPSQDKQKVGNLLLQFQ